MGQTSMKRSELEALGDGDRISVGSKEVELGDPISADDFLSGSCFDTGGGGGGNGSGVGSSSGVSACHPTPSAPLAMKPFKNPMGNRSLQSNVQTNGVPVAPGNKVAGKLYQ